MNTIDSTKKLVENNPCTETTCQNGGTCYHDGLMITKCFCKEGFDGKNCENVKRPTTTTSTTTSTTELDSKQKTLILFFFSL